MNPEAAVVGYQHKVLIYKILILFEKVNPKAAVVTQSYSNTVLSLVVIINTYTKFQDSECSQDAYVLDSVLAKCKEYWIYQVSYLINVKIIYSN